MKYSTEHEQQQSTNVILHKILNSHLIDCCSSSGTGNSSSGTGTSNSNSNPHAHWTSTVCALQYTIIEGPVILQVNEIINVNQGLSNRNVDPTNPNAPIPSTYSSMNSPSRLLKLSCTTGFLHMDPNPNPDPRSEAATTQSQSTQSQALELICMEMEYMAHIRIGDVDNVEKNPSKPILYPGGKVCMGLCMGLCVYVYMGGI